jgi:hypothetical protein
MFSPPSKKYRRKHDYFKMRANSVVGKVDLPNEFSQQNVPNGDFTEPLEEKANSHTVGKSIPWFN